MVTTIVSVISKQTPRQGSVTIDMPRKCFQENPVSENEKQKTGIKSIEHGCGQNKA